MVAPIARKSKEPRSVREAAEHIEKELEKGLKAARAADLGTLVLILEQALDEARALKNGGPR